MSVLLLKRNKEKASNDKTIPSVYKVCDKDTEDAIPLYDGIDKKGEICRYVVKTEYCGEPALADKYFLGQNDKSGGGDGFGAECENMGTYKTVLPAVAENLVFDTDGVTVVGYVYGGDYDYYSNGDINRYKRDIFLPIGGSARCTDYKYSYTVYPYDGTSSSSSSSKYTCFASR